MKTSISAIPAAMAIAFSITACGGSGDNGPAAQLPANTLAITSGNATSVSKVSWETANATVGISDLVGGTGLVASTPGGVAKAQPGYLKTGALVNVVRQVPVGPEVFPCQVSGSVTVSGDLANPLTLTRGDTLSVDSDACDDGLGEVVDGLLEFTVDEFEGDLLAASYLLTMTMRLSNFQITTANDVITSGGDATVSLDTRSAPAVSASVSGDSLMTSSNARTFTLSEFLSMQTVDGGVQPSPYTLSSSGALDDSSLSGTLSYSTPVMFQGFDVDYPDSGELLVTGDKSSARLIAVDNVNVRIEIDTDGDNVVDETIDTTWADLTS